MTNLEVTKDELLYFYKELRMGVKPLAKKYNTSILRIQKILKYYEIPSHTPKEVGKFNSEKAFKPIPEKFTEEYKKRSVFELTKYYGVNKEIIYLWAKQHNLLKKNHYNIDIENLQSRLLNYESPFKIVKELNVDPSAISQKIKYHNLIVPTDPLLTIEEVQKELVNLDWENKHIVQQINSLHPRLYKSILELTKCHILQSNKVTEKIYRIINNISHDKQGECKLCKIPLKFYTMQQGYGYEKDISDLCRRCIPKEYPCYGAFSLISQKLFLQIYNKLPINLQNDCMFYKKSGKEHRIKIHKEDHTLFENLNKYYYLVDFWCNQKAIEFDGNYWHSRPGIEDKDKVRDEYFKYRNIPLLRIKESDYRKDPNSVSTNCLNFLNS